MKIKKEPEEMYIIVSEFVGEIVEIEDCDEAISLAQEWMRKGPEEYAVIAHRQVDGKMRRVWPNPEWDYRC